MIARGFSQSELEGEHVLDHPSENRIDAGDNAGALPTCSIHVGSLVRRYRTQGLKGPGVYPQCVPVEGEPAHLLSWSDARTYRQKAGSDAMLSPVELDVLRDAANGLTCQESAKLRAKSTETVKSQRKSVMTKLGARNMTHAVGTGSAIGLICAEQAA